MCAFDCDNTLFPNLTQILNMTSQFDNKEEEKCKNVIKDVAMHAAGVFLQSRNPMKKTFIDSLKD